MTKMKKIIYFIFLSFVGFIFINKISWAKILSDEYLKGVVQINLRHGYLFEMCVSEFNNIEESFTGDGKENKNIKEGLTNLERIEIGRESTQNNFQSSLPNSEVSLLNPETQEKELDSEFSSSPSSVKIKEENNQEIKNCDPKTSKKTSLILANLDYVYEDGIKKALDKVVVLDGKIYRLDSVQYDYFEDNPQQLRSINAQELWLVDKTLPYGQESTRGNLLIEFKKENPKNLETVSAGETINFLAGEINSINLILKGKSYTTLEKLKELADVPLLIIKKDVLPTPLPSNFVDRDFIYPTINLSETPKDIVDFNKTESYVNKKYGFSLQYPLELFLEERVKSKDELKPDYEILIGYKFADAVALEILIFESEMRVEDWWQNEGIKKYNQLARNSCQISNIDLSQCQMPEFSSIKSQLAAKDALIIKNLTKDKEYNWMPKTITLVSSGKNIFMFNETGQISTASPLDKYSPQVVEFILSTFKFIE